LHLILFHLPILAAVSSAFDPPEGAKPFSYVFDLTGELNYDRPEQVDIAFFASLLPRYQLMSTPIQIQINHTAIVAQNCAKEAVRREVKAYVRLQHPWYECSEKGSRDEKDNPTPVPGIGTWWHETLRILGAIDGCV
jgi:hypothetical protein